MQRKLWATVGLAGLVAIAGCKHAALVSNSRSGTPPTETYVRNTHASGNYDPSDEMTRSPSSADSDGIIREILRWLNGGVDPETIKSNLKKYDAIFARIQTILNTKGYSINQMGVRVLPEIEKLQAQLVIQVDRVGPKMQRYMGGQIAQARFAAYHAKHIVTGLDKRNAAVMAVAKREGLKDIARLREMANEGRATIRLIQAANPTLWF